MATLPRTFALASASAICALALSACGTTDTDASADDAAQKSTSEIGRAHV